MTDVVDGAVDIAYKGVLYADGGFYANDRAGGWGLHGYVYSADALPTKGSGNPKASPLATGYSTGKDEDNAVQVINYVDAFGGVVGARDNNHTELIAVKNALKYSLDKGLSTTLIYSDSAHVVKGLNEYLPRWKQMGWRTHSGNDVAYKEDWLKVDELLTRHREKQSAVELAWIKGHAGHLGNELADGAAGRGNSMGLNGDSGEHVLEGEPAGYWKRGVDYNRLLDHPKWYFSSDAEESSISACGRHIYWTGQHGEDEYPGKPQADTSNAVIYLKNKIELLDRVKTHFIEQDQQQHGHMFIGVLRNIFNADTANDIMRCGLSVFRRNKANLSLQTQKRMPVVVHANPIGLIYYNIDHLGIMQGILNQYMAGDKSLIVTDLTDLLYESVEKKKQSVYQLRKKISNTVKHLDVAVNYNTDLAPALRKMDAVPTQQTKLRLIVGSDILGRNALSAIASDIKRVVVLTWRESDTAIRYATVVETENDIGLWANPFGNFKLVS